MNRLAGLRKVTQNRKVIPFEAYFMSCNLDHVLQNKLNLSDAEKEKGAYEFADKCRAIRDARSGADALREQIAAVGKGE